MYGSAMRAGLQEEPLVIRARARDGDGQTGLEGHVESRRAAGELHPAEVVKRVATRRDQLEDAIEPPGGPGNLQRGARDQSKGTEAGDEGDEELLVALIVGNVEKDVLRRVALSDRSASA
jgi:hypothetical protein